MSKENKECVVLSFTDKAWGKCDTSMHCNTIVTNNGLEPEDYILQRHLTNLVTTYGRKFVAEVIHNMALDTHQSKKVG